MGGDRFRVDRDSHLVLNRGEPYTLDIDEAQPVETFVAFLDKARLLIEMTDMPLAEVCASVGYESLPSFLRAFRKRVGETPTTLRARIRKEG